MVESGVDYLLVRAAPSDRVTDRYGAQANVVVAPVGRLPGGLQASRSQARRMGRGLGPGHQALSKHAVLSAAAGRSC